MKKLLMGNEAIALGAIRAGVSVVAGYPGTPSTEILETVARESALPGGPAGIHVEWSVNEKSALEVAAGAALSGVRAMVTMKQVGLNVASDPLMSLNYLGVSGGLVVVVADDPGPVSSQTEQDTRHFGRYAKIAVFDPSNPEEAYLMAADAFDYSTQYGRPVILRPTTRVCHSYASVDLDSLPLRPAGVPAGFSKSGGRWVIFPPLALKNHAMIEEELVKAGDDFSAYRGNSLVTLANEAQKKESIPGIAAGGVSYTYAMEYLGAQSQSGVKVFKAGTFPLPLDMALRFLEGLSEVLVLEELDPVIEDELLRICGSRHLPVEIRGKRSGYMPRAGAYTPNLVAEKIEAFLGKAPTAAKAAPEPPPLPTRPPVLCAGCPHRGSFYAVKEAVRTYGKGRKAVFCGDIGCYTLGNAQPLDMVDTCLCMGAGITMAQGIGRADPTTLAFAFIGDSTFFHTGIPGLVNAVYNRSDIIVIILDNGTTAMTGNQPHPGMGIDVMGRQTAKISIPNLVAALGVTELVRANPFDLEKSQAAIAGVLDKSGVRVVIFEGPCITVKKGKDHCTVDPGKCTACMVCVKKLGCPAISIQQGKAQTDPDLCTGCGICKGICPAGAIV